MSEEDRTVFPGDYLASEEEYVSGENTFGDDEGNVFAATIGKPSFDAGKRVVTVRKPGAVARPLAPGAVVVARVTLVKDNMLVVEMLSAEKNGVPLSIGQSAATIMVSRVSRAYVRNLNEEFCAGDLLKAVVLEVNDYGVELSTADPRLGVIKAFCSKCRSPMGLFSGKLKCTMCGSLERRTLSSDYVIAHA